MEVLGVCRMARDPAKVEGWVRFPARTFPLCLTLEPDGQATGCNPVEVGSTPTGVLISRTGRLPDQLPVDGLFSMVEMGSPGSHFSPQKS